MWLPEATALSASVCARVRTVGDGQESVGLSLMGSFQCMIVPSGTGCDSVQCADDDLLVEVQTEHLVV